MRWNIGFFESARGKFPVEEFIISLEVKSQARIAKTLDLLEEFGIKLGMPYTKYLERQLWELRIRLEEIVIGLFIFYTPRKPSFCSMGLPKRRMQCPEQIYK